MKPIAFLVVSLGLSMACHVGAARAADGEAWSWQQPQAKVLPTGDLEWAPRAFEYKPGASVRYIDFDGGADTNDGLSTQTAWKHPSMGSTLPRSSSKFISRQRRACVTQP